MAEEPRQVAVYEGDQEGEQLAAHLVVETGFVEVFLKVKSRRPVESDTHLPQLVRVVEAEEALRERLAPSLRCHVDVVVGRALHRRRSMLVLSLSLSQGARGHDDHGGQRLCAGGGQDARSVMERIDTPFAPSFGLLPAEAH